MTVIFFLQSLRFFKTRHLPLSFTIDKKEFLFGKSPNSADAVINYSTAQDQFFMSYEEMAKTMEQFTEVVDGISNQLSSVAQTLEETDQALADSLKG